jgi:hypothetical protein
VRHGWRVVSLILAIASAGPLPAQEGGPAGTTGPGAVPLAGRAEGALIHEVRVELRRASGNAARDGAVLARVRESMAGLEGRSFSRLAVEGRLTSARQRIGLGRIDYRLLDEVASTGIVLLVEIDTVGEIGAPAVTGVLVGDSAAFPTLYRSGRALFTTVLTGGWGVYSDADPWFGQPALLVGRSPVARHLPGSWTTWTEGFVEAGLGAAAQIGDTPFYAYGALTALSSWSLGQDIYRDDPRSVTGIEKAYAGLLYVDPARGHSLNVSAGRQNVTLNDGFLVHFVRGSANIGPRGGTYLGPRNASDFAVVLDGRAGPWSLKAFYIDPNELGTLESGSTFAGLNLRYDFSRDFAVDGTVIRIPRSNSAYANPFGLDLPREGLATLAAHARWTRALGVEGLWVAGEVAHQSHDDYAMSAWAGYGLVGYRAAGLPWMPSLSYRYSAFSGDDPATLRYERYDPLLSTGLGNWLQGVTFGKIASNSNLAVHRLQFNVTPVPALNLTLEWHLLRAPELNNVGGVPALSRLSSHDLGQEFTFSVRWAISHQLYLQNLASVALPGEALRDIGADKPWTTLQTSLYWSF